jgi:uncharacterized protein YkwD
LSELRWFAPFSGHRDADLLTLGVLKLLDLARRAPARLAVLTVGVIALLSACTPLNSQEQYLVGQTNVLRTDNHLAGLYEYEPLTAKARAWAATLASQGRLAHSDLRQLGVSYSAAAENVGRAGSVEDVFNLLAASPSHRANMLNGAYGLTGIGTARGKDGSVYAVQLFIRT